MKATIEFNGKVGEITLTKEQQKVFAEVMAEKKSKFELGDNAYYLKYHGGVDYYVYEDDCNDREAVKRNKYFFTVEEAQFQADKELLIAEIDRFIEENGGEFTEEEWRKGIEVRKYFISYRYKEHNIATLDYDYANSARRINEQYYRTAEIADKAIELFGERMKKYLL